MRAMSACWRINLKANFLLRRFWTPVRFALLTRDVFCSILKYVGISHRSIHGSYFNFEMMGNAMAEKVLQEYDAKLDNKRRCVIHGNLPFERYHIKIFDSGKIEMNPRVLASPDELSEKTLRMIYGSIKNLKENKAGSTVDFKKYGKYLKDPD